MSDRETKTINLPSGSSAVIYAFLTGREINQVKRSLFEGVLSEVERPAPGTLPKLPPMPLVKSVDRDEALLKASVVSVNGVSEKAIELALDLPGPDFAALSAEVAKLSDGTF